MKYILIFCTSLLTGCASFLPVTYKIPDAPAELMAKCDELELIDKSQVTLSELSKTVVRNYGKYHNCAEIVRGWQEWHSKQKSIVEGINK